MSESCATDGCPGNALPRSLTLLAALIANPTSFARFSIYVNSTSEIVPSSLDEMCVKGAKTNLFLIQRRLAMSHCQIMNYICYS